MQKSSFGPCNPASGKFVGLTIVEEWISGDCPSANQTKTCKNPALEALKALPTGSFSELTVDDLCYCLDWMVRYFLAKGLSLDAAHDCGYNVFVRVLGKAPDKTQNYLAASCRNEFGSFWREQGRQPGNRRIGLDQVQLPTPTDSMDSLEIRELRDALRDAVEELPKPLRMVVKLHHFDGLSQRVVANRLNIPTSTVSLWLARAKEILCERLNPLGH
jgi:RNA polymerase sigma factor (sigma-70 family)